MTDSLRSAVEWVLNDAAYKAPEQITPEARRWIARLREAIEPAEDAAAGPRLCYELKLGGVPAGPCVLNHGHQPPHRDQMGNEWSTAATVGEDWKAPSGALEETYSDNLAEIGGLLGLEVGRCDPYRTLLAARARIPAWRDAAGAISALAATLELEPPLPSPDEIVAVAVDGLLLLREAYEADQAEDLDRLREVFARAGKTLGKMRLPPAEEPAP